MEAAKLPSPLPLEPVAASGRLHLGTLLIRDGLLSAQQLEAALAEKEEHGRRLAGRLARLRVFPDADGRFDRSVLDTGGAVLVVSQFTLIADTRKGNRPSFAAAARPERAEPLYAAFCEALGREGVRVETGVFGARMLVELENDGPVTILLET